MNEEITHLDLCSGIGGFALALADAGRRTDRNVHTIAFCEPDKFCQQVLTKHWPDTPVYDDVKTFPKEFGKVSILTSGYPCQAFSQAGLRKGTADDRHIWPWVLEITKQTRPDVAVFENVVGHISMGLDAVLLDLENEGYNAWPCVLGAISQNAPHRRQRVWIVCYDMADTISDTKGAAHRLNKGIGEQHGHEQNISQGREVGSYFGDSGQDVADTDSEQRRSRNSKGQDAEAVGQPPRHSGHYTRGMEKRSAFSGLGGTFNGLSTWVDADWERGVPRVTTGQKDRAKRLKALGNSIAPQVASEIFQAVLKTWDNNND